MLGKYIHWPSKLQLIRLSIGSSSNFCIQHDKLLLPSNYLLIPNQQNNKNSNWLANSILGSASAQSQRYSTLTLYVKMFGQRVKLWSGPKKVCSNKSVTFCSSGTKTFLAFLIIGCGFRSSSVNLCLRGLKSSPPGTLDSTKSAGSGLKFTSTSTQSGSMGLGVFLSFCGGDSGNNRKSHNTFSRIKRIN